MNTYDQTIFNELFKEIKAHITSKIPSKKTKMVTFTGIFNTLQIDFTGVIFGSTILSVEFSNEVKYTLGNEYDIQQFEDLLFQIKSK